MRQWQKITPKTLQIEGYESSTLSSISPQVAGTPKKIGEQQQSIEMGLPPTPPSWMLKMLDLSFLEEGYDSDMQIGCLLYTSDAADE